MQLLFLDESGKLDQGGLFALGGVAVRDEDWPHLKELWQETLGAHSWPPDKEVKWHGIRKGEVPPALADAIYDALAVAPVACYVAVMDLDRGPEEFSPNEFDYFRSPEDVYATALMFLAERFEHRLAGADERGLIVVDSRFREDDYRLRRFFGATLAAERGIGLGSGYFKKVRARFAVHPATGELEGVGLSAFPRRDRARSTGFSKLGATR